MTRLTRIFALTAASGIAIGIAAGSASAQEVNVPCRVDVTLDSFECGDGANTTGDDTTAVGDGSLASDVNATAVGSESQATGRSSTAIGSGGTASRPVIAGGGFSTAVGTGSQIAAGATGATAVGDFNTIGATGSFAVAFGAFNTVNATSGIAIGNSATVTLGSTDGLAMGTSALASAAGATAMGRLAAASGANSLAIGTLATASAANATALGNGSTAAFAGSTAVGNGATTTRTNQVSVGGAGSSVRVGDIAASTAAQTGPLSFVTVDATGTLGRTDLSGFTATQTAQGLQIGTLFDLADIERRDIDRATEGVAMALAMESPSLPAGATFAVGGGFAYYNHKTAGTATFAARIGTMSAISGGIGIGLNSGEVGARAGFEHAW